MAYRRTYKGDILVAASNFYGKEAVWNPETDLKDYQYLLGNYSGRLPEEVTVLRPYETRLYYRNK